MGEPTLYNFNGAFVCLGYPLRDAHFSHFLHQGPVVQSLVSAKPGLKFNPQFLHFYPSVPSKTLGTKTSIDIEKISKEIFPRL